MPNVYKLSALDGTTDLVGNEQFYDIDEKMCEHFGVEPHDVDWYQNWENIVGVQLATGRTFDEILDSNHLTHDQKAAVGWLRDNYSVNCWYEHK